MAKRKHSQDDTQELPPVTVETVDAKPLKTVETVEIVPVDESPIPLPAESPVVDDSEDCYIFNEDTGELRLTRVRAGYAPAPMPFGFRVAKNEEIPGK